jgi:uncharacterized membrane protein
MKWVVRGLLGLVVIVLVALTALFVASQREGAARMEGRITINRPAREVWPWLVQGEKLTQWVSWLVKVEDEGGPFDAKGSRQVWTMEDRNNNNQLMKIRGVAEVVAPPHELAVKVSAAEGFSGVNRYELKETGAGTEVHMVADYDFDNWAAKLLVPLIMSQAREKFAGDLARLKEKAEAAR